MLTNINNLQIIVRLWWQWQYNYHFSATPRLSVECWLRLLDVELGVFDTLSTYCPPPRRDFRRGEIVSTLNCRLWCKCDAIASRVRLKVKVTRICFVATFLSHLLNQQAHYPTALKQRKDTVEKVQQCNEGDFEAKERFVSCSFRKKSFQWWSFEAALKPFPSRFWKRWWTTTLHWINFKELKTLSGFLLSRGSRCGICCFCLSPLGGSVYYILNI